MRHYLTRAIHPLAKIAMRELYARAFAAGDSSERKQRLSTALRWRRYAYPPGGRLLEIATLKEGARLWVNLCKLEGANLYFGTLLATEGTGRVDLRRFGRRVCVEQQGQRVFHAAER